MIFNVVSGGLISTITVNTLAGASVTCVLSPFSYSATANSSGVATFTVHMKGTWTCTATKNSVSESGTVSISGNGESKSVTLTLRKYIFKSGSGAQVAITVPSNSNYNSERIYLYGDAKTDSGVTVTNYSKLVVECGPTSGHTSAGFLIYVGSTQIGSVGTGASERGTYTLDISSYTGSQILKIHYGSSLYGYIYNWYLAV